MGLLDLLKTKKQEAINPKDVIFYQEFLIVGEEYECRKNTKKQRKDIVKKTKVGDIVHLEKYQYQGKPAYMIVNTKLDLDLGVLSAGAAEWISPYYSKGNLIVELTEKCKNTFRIKIIILKK